MSAAASLLRRSVLLHLRGVRRRIAVSAGVAVLIGGLLLGRSGAGDEGAAAFPAAAGDDSLLFLTDSEELPVPSQPFPEELATPAPVLPFDAASDIDAVRPPVLKEPADNPYDFAGERPVADRLLRHRVSDARILGGLERGAE